MAVGRKFNSVKPKRQASNEEESLEFGVVRYGLRRKRIAISSDVNTSISIQTPLKKKCSRRINDCFKKSLLESQKSKSPLESLPQDILIRILCGVNHEDLDQLNHVSETIKEATLIAKESHFAFSTPRKTPAFRNTITPDESIEIETPEAPKISRTFRSPLSRKSLASITVALFT